MKNNTFKMLIAAAALLLGGSAKASDFGLAALNVEDIRAIQADVKAPALKPVADELIGVDMNIRVPYKTLKKATLMVAASEKRLTIINKDAPVIFKSGEFLKISNIHINANGIEVIPTLTLKPYLEAKDRLAVRVQRIQLHASMEPSVKAAPMPVINQEEIMAQVMDVLVKGVYSSLNNFLKEKQIPMKAEDVVRMQYNKADWTLRATVSSRIIGQFVPPGLVGELHLTGFSFNDSGLVLNIQTPN
ncbi:MAG: hypothetical protein A2049_07980 [Elusimicrobia bacterium GWA2_62_23]|nr:MAG: hypothetical protein A2049_07980 [Elusimicrobia bacterium GWA2_62_23]OGR71862.1 MAG: hypothetical protein A2179_01160 [Elusimicrobia bacterium GWC2_63_65]